MTGRRRGREALHGRAGLRAGALGALGVLVAGLVLTACGTPPEDSPRLISADELQFDPAETATTATTTTTTVAETRPVGTLPEPATQPATLYFIDEQDRLVPVQRDLRTPPDLTTVLGALLAGPSPLEEALGLRSTLPPGAVVRVNVDRGVAQVALKEGLFDEILTRDQVLAFAQVVLTLTAQPGIGQVNFTSGGEEISGQRGDGSVARPGMPLTFEDYAELIEGYEPPVTSPSTTSPSTTSSPPRAAPPPTTTTIAP